MTIHEVEGGLEVTETSDDPQVVALIQAHARVVSLFAERGFAEARVSHDIPSTPEPEAGGPATSSQQVESVLQLSAEFDRLFIPALALTNQRQQQASLAAIGRLRDVLPAISKRMQSEPPQPQAVRRLFSGVNQDVEDATEHIQEGNLRQAHEVLEQTRDRLARKRQQLGIAYPLDALNDFHARMESIVKPVAALSPSEIDDGVLIELRANSVSAVATWARVEQTSFAEPYLGLTETELATVRELVTAERLALGRLNESLGEGDAAAVLNAAARIKPPFAQLYMIFGDFDGLSERPSE